MNLREYTAFYLKEKTYGIFFTFIKVNTKLHFIICV